MWHLAHEEGWVVKNWCLWIVVLKKTLESLGCKEIKPILKEINPEYSLEGLMLKLKLRYFGHLMWKEKDLDAGKDQRQTKEEAAQEEMVRQHHWLNGHEFEETPGNSEGQGSLVCCSPWICKESDTAYQLNNYKYKELDNISSTLTFPVATRGFGCYQGWDNRAWQNLVSWDTLTAKTVACMSTRFGSFWLTGDVHLLH